MWRDMTFDLKGRCVGGGPRAGCRAAVDGCPAPARCGRRPISVRALTVCPALLPRYRASAASLLPAAFCPPGLRTSLARLPADGGVTTLREYRIFSVFAVSVRCWHGYRRVIAVLQRAAFNRIRAFSLSADLLFMALW